MDVDKLLDEILVGEVSITMNLKNLGKIMDLLEEAKVECVKRQAYLGAANVKRVKQELINGLGK